LKSEISERLGKQLDNILLLASNQDSKDMDYEKMVVGLMDIIPFDDSSRGKIKSQIEKIKDNEGVKQFLEKVVMDVYSSREKEMGDELVRQVEKFAYLGSIDKHWIDHIDHLDGLREGVRLRAYGQRDPLVEFKNEAFDLFEGLLGRIDEELAGRVFRVGVARAPRPEIPLEAATTNVDTTDATGLADTVTPELGAEGGQPAFTGGNPAVPFSSKATEGRRKIGRNDPCWCGSGKKWKKCHYPQLG